MTCAMKKMVHNFSRCLRDKKDINSYNWSLVKFIKSRWKYKNVYQFFYQALEPSFVASLSFISGFPYNLEWVKKILIKNKHLKMQKHDYHVYLRGHSNNIWSKKKFSLVRESNPRPSCMVPILLCSLSLSLSLCVRVDVCVYVCVCVLVRSTRSTYDLANQNVAKRKKWSPRNPDFLWRWKKNIFKRYLFIQNLWKLTLILLFYKYKYLKFDSICVFGKEKKFYLKPKKRWPSK